MYKIACGQSGDHNCAVCKKWTGKGSGEILCLEFHCCYKFSFIKWVKAVIR